ALAIYATIGLVFGIGHKSPQAITLGAILIFGVAYLLAQGLAAPANREALARMTAAVVAAGAFPAVTGVVGGRIVAGMDDGDLERFLAAGAPKVSARDLAWAAASGNDGATTVAATLAIMAAAKLDVFATGGIGGVHRDAREDESADLTELSRTSGIVVCAGAKAILDLPATVERLETLGVTVLGYGTDEFPGFFTARTGLRVGAVVDRPDQVARVLAAQRALGRTAAVLVVQPPPPAHALDAGLVEEAVRAALGAARQQGVRGPGVTPFLLAAVERATGGASVAANLALLEANAGLAAAISAAVVAGGGWA
ncbi:MAG: pseudouridine-5'-phosphate glycosidase, partial [Gemmatimonadota bacterium]|nr:pseudouridine-5'-phosphate glycosidase [Gemmatimonadota bacterium]